jgi:peptidoglycan/xylan/chitin deacetylase (PgdA/CDA1 family)
MEGAKAGTAFNPSPFRALDEIMRRLGALLLQCLALEVSAGEGPVEVHHVLDLPSAGTEKVVALTLDACGGGFDRDLIQLLIDRRIPATIFATKRWLGHNPSGLALIKAHSDLFEVEDHGARHVPAVIGADRRVYGILGHPDIAHLQAEVTGGAEAVEKATGVAPRWYRAATAEYDPEALAAITDMGFKVAGFSLNVDDGATLDKEAIVIRMRRIKRGDILIAHMNRPNSDTAEALVEILPSLVEQGFRFVKLGDFGVRPAAGGRTARVKGPKPLSRVTPNG